MRSMTSTANRLSESIPVAIVPMTFVASARDAGKKAYCVSQPINLRCQVQVTLGRSAAEAEAEAEADELASLADEAKARSVHDIAVDTPTRPVG